MLLLLLLAPELCAALLLDGAAASPDAAAGPVCMPAQAGNRTSVATRSPAIAAHFTHFLLLIPTSSDQCI
jgi:hypothetical protein